MSAIPKYRCNNCKDFLSYSCFNTSKYKQPIDAFDGKANVAIFNDGTKKSSRDIKTLWQKVKDQDQMGRIYRKISQKQSTKQGLQELYDFKKINPNVDEHLEESCVKIHLSYYRFNFQLQALVVSLVELTKDLYFPLSTEVI